MVDCTAPTDRERKAAYDREYYARNREKRAAQKRAYYLANLDKARAYYLEHKQEQIARNAERRARLPEEHRERQRQRRAAIYGSQSHRVTTSALVRARNRARGMCEYCLTSPGEHWDHKVPLIRGGSHGEGNLVLACAFCNHQKHAKTVMEWRVWRRRAGLPDLSSLTVL